MKLWWHTSLCSVGLYIEHMVIYTIYDYVFRWMWDNTLNKLRGLVAVGLIPAIGPFFLAPPIRYHKYKVIHKPNKIHCSLSDAALPAKDWPSGRSRVRSSLISKILENRYFGQNPGYHMSASDWSILTNHTATRHQPAEIILEKWCIPGMTHVLLISSRWPGWPLILDCWPLTFWLLP